MKVLIIRFSSFGDVLQCLSVAGALARQFPDYEIHWAAREEFRPLVETHPNIKKVWTIPKGAKFLDVMKLSSSLKSESFTHVYDAHHNLRSHLIGWKLKGLLDWRVWLGQIKSLLSSTNRRRRFAWI